LRRNLGTSNKGFNFDEFKSGGQHGKHAVATWNLEIISSIACGQKKTKETCVEMAYCRASQMPPDFQPTIQQVKDTDEVP
jgi:hypothetical protein